MDWNTLALAVTGLISAALGTGGGAGILAVLLKHKTDRVTQLFRHYNNMIKIQDSRIQELEDQHLNCTQENADMREEIGRLRAIVARVESYQKP